MKALMHAQSQISYKNYKNKSDAYNWAPVKCMYLSEKKTQGNATYEIST